MAVTQEEKELPLLLGSLIPVSIKGEVSGELTRKVINKAPHS